MNLPNQKSININGIDMKELYADGVCIWKAITSRIPSEYQEVEYIKSASEVGAYINLGFSFDTSARIKIGMYLNNVTPSYLFGSAENSGKYRCMISAPYGGGSHAYFYGSTGSSNISANVALVLSSVNDLDYVLKAGEASCTNNTNGKSYKVPSNVAFTMTSKLYLMAQNYNGNLRYGGARQIHYFKYYDKTDTLICDLVPCYRKSDGVVGMYDVARKTFLTNAGSGTFTKGADV